MEAKPRRTVLIIPLTTKECWYRWSEGCWHLSPSHVRCSSWVCSRRTAWKLRGVVWWGSLLRMKVEWTITLQKHYDCFLKALVGEEGQRSYYVLTMALGIFIDDCHHGSFSGSRRKISDEIFKGYIFLAQSQSGPEPTWCQIKGSASIYCENTYKQTRSIPGQTGGKKAVRS